MYKIQKVRLKCIGKDFYLLSIFVDETSFILRLCIDMQTNIESILQNLCQQLDLFNLLYNHVCNSNYITLVGYFGSYYNYY